MKTDEEKRLARKKANRAWAEANREKRRLAKRVSYSKNKAAAKERMKAYREKNKASIQAERKAKYQREKEERRAASKAWRDTHKEQNRKTIDAWHEKNPGAKMEMNRRRKLKQKQATPSWADTAAMRLIYNEAADLSKRSGRKLHVDHIIPINSPYVCGLHCPQNLQVVSAAKNMAKHNKLMQPDESVDYLASPYSHEDPAVRQSRFHAACAAAAALMCRGRLVFSPIAHSHSIAQYLPDEMVCDFDFWMLQDLPMLIRAQRLIVLMLDGWRESRGVHREICFAVQHDIPIQFMECPI